jgi:hypothetical protein
MEKEMWRERERERQRERETETETETERRGSLRNENRPTKILIYFNL